MGEQKKLHFYGGEWTSFLPFIIFLVLILQTTFFWGSISDGALWVPAFAALAIPFFLAKEKSHFSDVIISGIASKEAIIPVVCWIFAGVFSRILRESGLAGAIAGVAANVGVDPTLFLLITFLAAAVFATASGTGFGTIAAAMGVLYPAGVELGCYPALLAGVIISGAAFGDNLAPVSDTTICSATSQGVDVPGVVRSRLKYAIVSGLLTIVAIFALSPMLTAESGANTAIANYNHLALLMLIPVAITVYTAIKSGDIIIATIIGTVSSSIFGIVFGLFDFLQVDAVDAAQKALIRVSGAGLDRTVDGILYSGIASMLQVCVLALLLFGSINIMRAGHGDQRLLSALGKIAQTGRSSELIVSAMVIALSTIMGLNAPAILAVGASFAKPLAKAHDISPYRMANLLSAQSTTLVYAMPWTPALIYTIGFAAGTDAPLAAIDITPYALYPYALLIVMTISIILKIGRRDGLDVQAKAAKA